MGLFNRSKTKVVEEEQPTETEDRLGLSGFKNLETIQWHGAHDARKWGDYVLARWGATWKLYTKEGYPLTSSAHHIHLGTFGDLECKVGAKEWEVDMHEIHDKVDGLRTMINAMIDERMKK